MVAVEMEVEMERDTSSSPPPKKIPFMLVARRVILSTNDKLPLLIFCLQKNGRSLAAGRACRRGGFKNLRQCRQVKNNMPACVVVCGKTNSREPVFVRCRNCCRLGGYCKKQVMEGRRKN